MHMHLGKRSNDKIGANAKDILMRRKIITLEDEPYLETVAYKLPQMVQSTVAE